MILIFIYSFIIQCLWFGLLFFNAASLQLLDDYVFVYATTSTENKVFGSPTKQKSIWCYYCLERQRWQWMLYFVLLFIFGEHIFFFLSFTHLQQISSPSSISLKTFPSGKLNSPWANNFKLMQKVWFNLNFTFCFGAVLLDQAVQWP